MAFQGKFEEHRKLLHYIANKVLWRMKAAGAKSTQIEDIFGELCVAWCVARDCWRDSVEVTLPNGTTETKRVPFGPYLMRGMSNHINRWVQKELRQFQIAPFDLDAEMSDDGDGTLHDILADESQTVPEQAVIEKDLRDYATDPLRWRARPDGFKRPAELSPEAKKFMEIIDDPPLSVLRVFEGLRARAEYARSVLKIPSAVGPARMTSGLVLDIMGIEDRKDRTAIIKQLEFLGERVSQQ